MSDIFISYAREDRAAASQLAIDLQYAGYSVWYDRDLLAGGDFGAVIAAELAAARAVIVIWSATSVRSHWVLDEAATALERGVLVPVTIDGAVPPLGFRSIHIVAYGQDTGELHRAVTRIVIKPTNQPILRRKFGVNIVEAICLILLLAAAVILFRKIVN